jgi:Chaperone of endosialidase
MYRPILFSTATLPPPSLISRSPSRRRYPAVLLALALVFALLPAPNAFAVSPPPDGGYPNANTAEGDFALQSLTTGANNTAIGASALFNNTGGHENTASGVDALLNNNAGTGNTANGFQALFRNTTGFDNAAIGANALFSNTTASANTASGVRALEKNTTGFFNTANGADALANNTTGTGNTANGGEALYSNTTASANTANGESALYSNTTGAANTANGESALYFNTTGYDNTANGGEALYSNTTGHDNVASGRQALPQNTTGYYNVASGVGALFSNVVGHDNTAEGFQALVNAKGSNNIGIGSNAGANLTSGSNNIDIGNLGVAGDAAKIRIGKQGTQTATYVAGIYGKTVASGTKVAAMIDSTGKLGTVVSSARFKNQIKPMDKASEVILALKPVTFRYKEELDPDGMPQFGLIAEEVEKINPDLVVRGEDGKVSTVRYEAVNAMLLNEFLKAHRTVQEQQVEIAQLKGQVAELKSDFGPKVAQQQKQIEALTATVQKVSDQIVLGKPAPQLVANP